MFRPTPRWSLGVAALFLGIFSLRRFGDRLFEDFASPSTFRTSWDRYAFFASMAAYHWKNGLEHPTRRRIYDHLLALPGDHFRSLVRSLDLSIGVTRHHLAVLMAQDFVYEDKSNGRTRYYAKALPAQSEKNGLYARHWGFRDTRGRIVRAVEQLGDATPTKVAKAMGISRQLAAYHLTQLERAKVLHREGGAYRIHDPTRFPKDTGP